MFWVVLKNNKNKRNFMKHKVKVTMLIAGLGLSGTPRIMMDIIENISRERYEISVAYKPEYPGFEDELLIPLKILGVQTIPLSGENLFSIGGIVNLYNHLNRNAIQIVHCWDALGMSARILKWFTHIRVVESFGNPVTSKGSFLYYWVNKLTSAFLDGVIFESEGVDKSFKQSDVLIFGNKLKTKVIHNCINFNKSGKKQYPLDIIRSRWHLDNSDVILTNVGIFNEQKAQIYLLQAMEIIIKEIPHAKLMLIGWGPKEKELKTFVNKMGLQNHVIFTGKLLHEDVFKVLAITDVFVLSSLWEGFGIVMGEAMAMGKPVVATRTDGSELLIVDNETGLLVPPGDCRSLAGEVIELLKNPFRMQRMGERGQQRIQTFFTPEIFIQRHESFYNEILQTR
jgi:glycosyltransferase involved in cell wall biosynthesis